MKFYPEEYEVTVEVSFTDLNGQPIVPTTVNATLTDGEDEFIAEFPNVLFEPGADKATIVIPRELNILGERELQGARILRIALESAAGTVRRSFSYVIENEFRLEILQNTFITYEAAEIAARNQVNTSGWNSADEQRRQAALIEAFGRITAIPMRYSFRDDSGKMLSNMEHYIARDQWATMQMDYFRELPTHFKQALRAAQFAEANELLQGDTAARKHRSGIITETIGESSVTLRGGRLDYGVSQSALAHLAGYIHFNVRIQRS